MLKKIFLICLLLLFIQGDGTSVGVDDEQSASSWKQALPGWDYRFPADHAIHQDYKTEWWYFTGNLQGDDGKSYGYELTFFRQGVLSPGEREAVADQGQPASRFVQNDFKFAHFAISDLSGGKFHFTQKISRGAFGEAGFGTMPTDANKDDPRSIPPLAWLENWSIKPQTDGAWKIVAKATGETPMSIDLRVAPLKGVVIEGTDGVSQKAAGLGNASHYYSFTRLRTTGTLALGQGGGTHDVHGYSWFDHEWASNQMTADQVGWDWFCFQFNDGTEMMLYAMRRRDGSVDPVSSGTWVAADGTAEHLRREDFQLKSLRSWQSGKSDATYPVSWQVDVPGRRLEFTITPRLDDQELVLPPVSYWEGAISVAGKEAGLELKGFGYMELTGYAAPMQALQNEKSTAENDLSRPPR